MKPINVVFLCLTVNGAFADTESVGSGQINSQILRSASDSISRNLSYRQANSLHDMRNNVDSVQNPSLIYPQRDNSSDAEGLSPSYFSTYSAPRLNDFHQ